MKKYLITLLISLFCVGFSFSQSTPIMFLDIPGLDGEYATPTRTKFTTQSPKAQNLLLTGYQFNWAAIVSFNKSSGVEVGKANEIGEMTLSFRIDKSVIGLFNRLVNNTKIAEMDIFIDKPANSTPQTELSRIKMYNITIRDLNMANTEIPQYTMRIRFEKVSMIVHTFNGAGVGTKGNPYCLNYISYLADNCFTF